MRLTMVIYWVLLALWLLTTDLGARAGGDVPVPVAGTPSWPSTVQGYGLTHPLARQHAMKEAVRLIGEYLEKLQPPLVEWKPGEEYVKNNLLHDSGTAGPDIHIHDGQPGMTWVLSLRRPNLPQYNHLNHQALLARQFQERQALAENRLTFTSRAFLVVVAVLTLLFSHRRWMKRTKKNIRGTP